MGSVFHCRCALGKNIMGEVKMVVTCKLGTNGCWNDDKCRATSNCECKMIANGDKIRSMSDEDLVTLVRAILKVEDCPVPGEHDCEGCLFNTLCSHFCKYLGNELEWLKEPAEE